MSAPQSPTDGRARVAVLGCGYWGKNLVRNFHALGALTHICDPGEAGRLKARELAPEVAVNERFEAVFEEPDIDAVVLATPAETHEQLALEALSAGKDVYVEKPMALTVEAGQRMRDRANELGRILMVGHILEYHPAVRRLRELLAAGELGKLNYLYSHRLNFGKVRVEENALWSFAPHDIAVMLRLVGALPEEVSCSGGSYITPGLADVTVSNLRFQNGVSAHIFVSWLNPFKEQKFVVVGDRRMAVFNDVSKDEKLQLFNQKVAIENRQPVLHKGDVETLALPEEEPLRNECAHFLDCVANRRQPLTDAASGLDTLRVLEACQQSLQAGGRPVQIEATV